MVKKSSTKPFGLKLSNWIYKEAGIDDAPNKSNRVEELIIKGMMFEKEKALNTASKVFNSDHRTMGLNHSPVGAFTISDLFKQEIEVAVE